jgi:hypothetical protein
MFWLLLLFVVGCKSEPTVLSPWQISLRSISEQSLTTQQETAETLKENTASLKSIEQKLEDIGGTLESGAPDSKMAPVAVPLLSSRVTSDGTTLRWNIAGDWNPDILETSAHLRTDHGINTNGMTHQQMADIHADLHDGNVTAKVKVVNRGTSCPNGRCPVPQRRGLFGGLFR